MGRFSFQTTNDPLTLNKVSPNLDLGTTANSTKSTISSDSPEDTVNTLKKVFVNTNTVRPAFMKEGQEIPIGGGLVTKLATESVERMKELIPRVGVMLAANFKQLTGKGDSVQIPIAKSRLGFEGEGNNVESTGTRTVKHFESLQEENNPTNDLKSTIKNSLIAGFTTPVFDALDVVVASDLVGAGARATLEKTRPDIQKKLYRLGMGTSNVNPDSLKTAYVHRMDDILQRYGGGASFSEKIQDPTIYVKAATEPLPASVAVEINELNTTFNDVLESYYGGKIPNLNKLGKWMQKGSEILTQDITTLGKTDSPVMFGKNYADRSLPGYRATPGPKMGLSVNPLEPTGYDAAPGRPIAQQVDEARNQLEMVRDILANHPAKSLVKYANKNGELPEVVGGSTGKFKNGGDSIVTELGFSDSESARSSYQDYREGQKQLKTLEEKYKSLRQQVRDEAMSTVKVGQTYNKVSTPEPTPPQDMKPVSTPSYQAELPEEGEARSLEKLARERDQQSTGQGFVDKSSQDYIISRLVDKSTPLKTRVGIIDYFRTPELVLKKIGLGKEATLLRSKYEDYLKELPKNIDKITAWSKEVPKESNQRIFKWLDGENVTLTADELKVGREIKTWLREWADRLKLPKDNRISDYITHIFPLGTPGEFDEDLAKIIADKIPKGVYDPFLLRRLGARNYIEDTWKALDAYVKRATRKVHMDVALEALEESAASLEKSQWDYIKQYIDRINMRPTDVESLIDNTIKQVIGYKAGQRPTAFLTQKARQWIYRGTLGLNVGSAVKNLTQGVNTFAELGTKYTVIGYTKLFTQVGSKELQESGVLSNDVIEDRTLSATKKAMQKFDKVLFSLFELAEKINRGSAYFGAKAKAISLGKTEEEAKDYAKDLVRKTQFAYGKIDTPVALQSNVVKTFFQFQTFTIKQGEFLIEKIKARNIAALIRYIVSTFVVFGTIGKAIGMKPSDAIPSLRFDIPPILKTPKTVYDALTNQSDKYGSPQSTTQKIQNVGNSMIPLIPAGVQAKRSIEGLGVVKKGKDTTATGKKRYNIESNTSNAVRAFLFGKYSLPESQKYYDKTTSKTKTNAQSSARFGF